MKLNESTYKKIWNGEKLLKTGTTWTIAKLTRLDSKE